MLLESRKALFFLRFFRQNLSCLTTHGVRRDPSQKEEPCVYKQQKQTIREMREENCGYTEIAI